jgi:hypothetical protein
MSAFITVVRAKKLKNFPQPDIGCGQDAGADAKLRRMEVDLSEQVMKLAARFILETDVYECVGVAEQIHCDASGGVSVSADRRQVQEAVCWLFCRFFVSSHPLPHAKGLLV